jgi:hypothetical protein
LICCGWRRSGASYHRRNSPCWFDSRIRCLRKGTLL